MRNGLPSTSMLLGPISSSARNIRPSRRSALSARLTIKRFGDAIGETARICRAIEISSRCGLSRQAAAKALEACDHAGFPARREASRTRRLLRGFGFANAIEQAAGPTPEYAEIRFQPSGSAILLMGTKTHGQGHETVFKQILYDRLGIDPKEVQFIDGDTDRVAFGMGSNGSRSMVNSAIQTSTLSNSARNS